MFCRALPTIALYSISACLYYLFFLHDKITHLILFSGHYYGHCYEQFSNYIFMAKVGASKFYSVHFVAVSRTVEFISWPG